MRAQKLQSRAARTGFDWPDPAPLQDKLLEELEEFNAATTPEDRFEEAGDLLFTVVNLLRHQGIDAESALRAGNDKFERRFRAMEALAGPAFTTLPAGAQEALWRTGKTSEKKPG
jgi:ATP diphosphatase